MDVDWSNLYWWQGVLIMLAAVTVELAIVIPLAWLWGRAEKPE